MVKSEAVHEKPIWGFHMAAHHGEAPIKEGYVAIGWPELGDPSKLAADRDAFKARYSAQNPAAPAGAVRVAAGQVFRFVHEMHIGDVLIFPSKYDRMINIGLIAGAPEYKPDLSEDYPNRRSVKWMEHFSRSHFSQNALYEIGSALTLFRVATHAEEFMSALQGQTTFADTDDVAVTAVSIAEQFEENTEDFVLKRLKGAQTAYEFEHFVAHLLKCMGYFARVTQASGDGGIDVIAHRDELGFEEPIIKVQCKQTFGTMGQPDVQKLFGAIEREEKGLFVTLGSFSPQARTFEQSKSNLRLIDGRGLVELIYGHYDKFSPQYQALIPLKRTFSAGA